MNDVLFAIIGTLVFIFAATLVVYFIGGDDVNGFKMTPELKAEEKQLQVCIMYNITDTRCNIIWGGPLK